MLIVPRQLANILQNQRGGASNRRQLEPLAGTPGENRFPQLEPQHLHDDPGRAGGPHEQQVRARHPHGLQILVGLAREAPLVSDLQDGIDAGRACGCGDDSRSVLHGRVSLWHARNVEGLP